MCLNGASEILYLEAFNNFGLHKFQFTRQIRKGFQDVNFAVKSCRDGRNEKKWDLKTKEVILVDFLETFGHSNVPMRQKKHTTKIALNAFFTC